MALPLTGLVSQFEPSLQGLLMQASFRWHSRPGHGGGDQRRHCPPTSPGWERRLPTAGVHSHPAPQGGPPATTQPVTLWRALRCRSYSGRLTAARVTPGGPSWGSPLMGPTELQCELLCEAPRLGLTPQGPSVRWQARHSPVRPWGHSQ